MKSLSNNSFLLSCYNKGWVHESAVSATGYAYVNGNGLLEAAQLIHFFDVADESEWLEKLCQCNGIFSVVCHNNKFKAAAIDSTRIHPLYYRITKEQIILTDDPYTLIQKGDAEDEDAVRAYTVSGATFEGTTLVKGISQIKPNHYLLPDGTQKKYYTYTTYLYEIHTPTYMGMHAMLNRVFQRLIQRLDGRQVVIPLSGGYDSRLVLCMLKRFGYQHVVCYTVGRPNNIESRIAQKVAQQLGYKWYDIDTTQEELQKLISPQSTDFQKYYTYLGGLCNFVWLFEYVAITSLKKRDILKEDAVFIPGHTADVHAGSHLTKACIHKKDTIYYLTSSLLYDSFEYPGQKQMYSYIRNYFKSQKRNNIADWSLFQSFIAQNRLPHNILNSARIYEHMGYEVALPFWDKEFIELFRTMPYEALLNKSFYTNYVRTQIFQPMQVDYQAPKHSIWYYYGMKVRKRIKSLLPTNIAHRFVLLQDTLGEKELSKSLLEELVQKKVYQTESQALSINQIIKDWYLLKVRECLQSNTALMKNDTSNCKLC